MQDLKSFFRKVKKKIFIDEETALMSNSGVLNRIAGRGTNENDKRTEPTPKEMLSIINGIENFGRKCLKLAKLLRKKYKI